MKKRLILFIILGIIVLGVVIVNGVLKKKYDKMETSYEHRYSVEGEVIAIDKNSYEIIIELDEEFIDDFLNHKEIAIAFKKSYDPEYFSRIKLGQHVTIHYFPEQVEDDKIKEADNIHGGMKYFP